MYAIRAFQFRFFLFADDEENSFRFSIDIDSQLFEWE